jgi:hypothetical protein
MAAFCIYDFILLMVRIDATPLQQLLQTASSSISLLLAAHVSLWIH